MDYIDISDENYFLGESLFSKNDDSQFDTIFTEGARYLSSKDENLEQIDFENEVVYKIAGYLSLSKNK